MSLFLKIDMVDLVEIVRRKSSRLRRKKAATDANGTIPVSSSQQLVQPESNSHQIHLMSHIKSIPSLTSTKTYRRSLDSMAHLLLPGSSSSEHFPELQHDFNGNESNHHQHQQKGSSRGLYLNRQSGSCNDLIYKMRQGRRSTSPTDPYNNQQLEMNPRTAISNSAQDHGEIINVPKLTAVGTGINFNSRKSRRSLDSAQLSGSAKRIVSDPTVHYYNPQQSYYNGDFNTTNISSPPLSNNSSFITHDNRKLAGIKATDVHNPSAPAEFIFNIIFHFVNFVLTTFVYLPIWFGIQLAKYTSGMLAIALISLFLYGAYCIFLQACYVITCSITGTVALIK